MSTASRVVAGAPAKPQPLAEEQLDALLEVLNDVRERGSRSRPGIIRSTGLTRAVVTSRVAELLNRGLLVDGTLGPSTGGRAPRQLEFRADAGHVLAADLGATSIDVAVADLSGRILGHLAEPADIADGSGTILGRVDELFGELLAGTAGIPGDLWGIGIGVPGPVDFGSGCRGGSADHARLGGVPHSRDVRRALQGAGVGRQ